MEAGDEAGTVDFSAAAGTVAEADDVGGTLRQTQIKCQPFGV
jgi:hypothetical protein